MYVYIVRKPRATCLLPGSPRTDGFHVLMIGLPQGGEQSRVSKEQTHQLGSQLSNTPYYPIARNDTKLS